MMRNFFFFIILSDHGGLNAYTNPFLIYTVPGWNNIKRKNKDPVEKMYAEYRRYNWMTRYKIDGQKAAFWSIHIKIDQKITKNSGENARLWLKTHKK